MALLCPLDQNPLTLKKSVTDNGQLIAYHECPACLSVWMKSFSPDALPLPNLNVIQSETPQMAHSAFTCPVCAGLLGLASATNVPEGAIIYRCPNNHGYFIEPQTLAILAKTLPSAPLDSEPHAEKKPLHASAFGKRSFILTALVGLVLALGLILTSIAGTRTQIVRSKAAEILTSHSAYVSDTKDAATIVAITTAPANIVVHIPNISLNKPMTTFDNRSHVLRVENLTKGTYDYYFTITVEGNSVQSQSYSFSVE